MATHDQINSEIVAASPESQNDVAAKHGRALYDLVCECGNEIKNHIVSVSNHRDWNPNTEVRYLECPKCGRQGRYKVSASA